MRILVTGATGFIGKAVCKRLNKHNLRLISRREQFGGLDDFFVKVMSSTEDFRDCLDKIDVVIHMAARVHQMNDKSENSFSKFMEINCYGTLNLAKQAVKAGVKRFIFLSSIKVNGERTAPGKPFKFDDIPRAIDPYGVSKAEAEAGLLKIANESSLEVIIIRPPLVYGPGVKANFQSLMRLSQRNLPLPLGSINNKRSLVALDNLVDLINMCIDHPNATNKILLISDDSDISTSGLCILIADAFGYKSRLFDVNPGLLKLMGKVLGKKSIVDRLCDNFQVDIEHTKDTLGWKPPVSMNEGIRLCVRHLRDGH